MAEYIERKMAYKLIKEQREKETGAYSKGRNKGLIIAGSIINNKEVLPTADVVEVKHGRWIDNGERDCNGVPKVFAISCSVCGSSAGASWMPYCPRCGAKMDVSKKEITTERKDT